MRLYELTATVAKLSASLLSKISSSRLAPGNIPRDVPVDDVKEGAEEEPTAIRVMCPACCAPWEEQRVDAGVPAIRGADRRLGPALLTEPIWQ